MIFGMSGANFTVLHVVISMIAIFAGFIVVGGMFSSAGLAGWTAFFLFMTILTNVTGFMFPIGGFTPALAVGSLSTLLLVVALFALYAGKLSGRWRTIYVVTAMVGLYLNVFVLIAQVVTLIAFVLLGWMALKKYHPMRLVM